MSQSDPALDDMRSQAAQLVDPNDPRPAWVWRGDGGGLLWANTAGLASLHLAALDGHEVVPSAPATRSLQAVARMHVGASGRGRIEILRVSAGGHQETLVATCRPVMLGDSVAILALGNASSARKTPNTEPITDAVDKTTVSEQANEAAPTEDVVTDDDSVADAFVLDIAEPGAVDTVVGPAEAEAEAKVEDAQETHTPVDDQPQDNEAPAFAFKPRSRPHRFSFLVNQAGRVESLSSGLQDAVGPSTALRDGEVASEALLAQLGDLPAAIFHGVDERRRFSEHEVMWPVSDHDLAVPVRLSAFDEDDGRLRVFGTALTGKAVQHTQEEPKDAVAPTAATALTVPPLSTTDAQGAGLFAETVNLEKALPAPAVEALAAAPLDDQAAQAAGLFASEPIGASNEPARATTAQLPGGATMAAAASAMAAGIAGALTRPAPTAPEEAPAISAIDDALESSEAETAGLWSSEPPKADPIVPLDDALQAADAETAGLWSTTPVESDPVAADAPTAQAPDNVDAPTPAESSEFPPETVNAMQAVAAGIAAGLTGGVAGGVVSAMASQNDDSLEPNPEDAGDAETGEEPEPLAGEAPAQSDEDDLSRPEHLTFQEIARRLGARITGRDDGESEPRASLSPLPTPEPASTGDIIHLAPGSDEVVIVDDEAHADQPTGESSGRVLPFTRAEPNAERMVLDRLPLGVIIYSDESILYGNRAALDLAGLSSLQALKAMDGIETLFADGMSAGDGAMTLVRPDGAPIPVTGRLQSVRWDDQPAALLSLREHTDADSAIEETAADASLLATDTPADASNNGTALPIVRARIGELEAIIDLASDGVVTLDGDGEIKDLNQAAQALVGYAADDLIGRPFRLLFPEDSRQTALDYLDDMASQGRLSLFNEGRELECITAQGGLVPVFMTLGRLTDDEPATFCAVLRDLSPFKQAETDLVAARKAAEEASAHKSDFLARVSHEIRTPLNAVIGFSEVMLEERFGPVGSERYRQYLRDIHTSGEHLMSLLNDLLDLSKIEAGKMELAFGEVDLNDVVQQCLAIMQPQANQGRIIVRTSLPLSLPKVVADVRSVRQVVLNLMSNAIKFTDAGGQIIVSTLYEPSGEVSLRVRDTGRGMDAADVALALEPFRQVPTTLNQVITGTGLGLPLTKALVEANRAQFGLESTPGEGTLAMMTFPSQRVLAE